ncbi:hypothetical protein [Nitratidesulfovibrio vulgaris]|uniref:hypothetical protein n=1 Tax=Nitratidesulfovibrio vulgaris TaxID=881 RepID=UPI0011415B7D|nr:hypothetical protein [Nitratidesulfovibrio vulgaris]
MDRRNRIFSGCALVLLEMAGMSSVPHRLAPCVACGEAATAPLSAPVLPIGRMVQLSRVRCHAAGGDV